MRMMSSGKNGAGRRFTERGEWLIEIPDRERRESGGRVRLLKRAIKGKRKVNVAAGCGCREQPIGERDEDRGNTPEVGISTERFFKGI